MENKYLFYSVYISSFEDTSYKKLQDIASK